MNAIISTSSPVHERGAARMPIAIIGIGCILPGGVRGPDSYWNFLCSGKSGIREVPRDRWNVDSFYDQNPDAIGKARTKWGGFVDGIADFDAEFFRISPREAESMDPQQRLLLHVAWEALEDAGIPADRLAGSRTGVFVGISVNDFANLRRANKISTDVHGGTGGALSIAANRLSHRFDLRGPSLSVDTACSSSLVAADIACASLADGTSDLALAAGVNLMLDPAVSILFSKANMMSPTGHCRSFDARADGYVRSEGVGVVVLKRLDDALAAGDRVYAVIRATAVNQDGQTTTITVPSADAQSALLRQAVAKAGLAVGDVTFVEAHGTGTPVGDPIEAHAIGSVFGKGRVGDRIIVGAGKSAIGHLESAAGIAGLIKTALCIERGAIPPNIDFDTPNPNIPVDDLNIAFPQAVTPWNPPSGNRIAVVNSFGFGGTNACAVLEQVPAYERATTVHASPTPQLVPLSAASDEALRLSAQRVADALEKGAAQDVTLADVANTLALHRPALTHRLAITAGDLGELRARLSAFARGETPAPASKTASPRIASGRPVDDNRVVFVFSGQGGQWPQMGVALLAADAVFREAVTAFDRAYREAAGRSVIAEIEAAGERSRINETIVSQPAIFALQLGLLARWRAWGITPDAVMGHSFGETAAAYAAGVLTLDDAAQMVHHRSRLSAKTAGAGVIYAAGLSLEQARERLAALGATAVDIAAVNGANLVNLAGATAAVESAVEGLRAQDPDVFLRRIEMDYAPHCRLLDAVEDEFRTSIAGLGAAPLRVPMISTVFGRPLERTEIDPGYWWANMRQPVQFAAALDHMLGAGYRLFVEIGPHSNIAALIRGHATAQGKPAAAIPSLIRGNTDPAVLHAALAQLFVAGGRPDWRGVNGGEYQFTPLPGHPWRMQRYFPDTPEYRDDLFAEILHPLLGRRLPGAARRWRNEISSKSIVYLADHQIDGAVVFPGAGYTEIFLAAGFDIYGGGGFELVDVAFVEAMGLSADKVELLETTFEEERGRLKILSRPAESHADWTLRASARLVRREPSAETFPAAPVLTGKSIITAGSREFYKLTEASALGYGPSFRVIRSVKLGAAASSVKIKAPASLKRGAKPYRFHPALLDGCFQILMAPSLDPEIRKHADSQYTYLPIGIERLRYFRAPTAEFSAHAINFVSDRQRIIFDILVVGSDGKPIAMVEGFTTRKLRIKEVGGDQGGARLRQYAEAWRAEALPAAGAAKAAPATWALFSTGDAVSVALAKRLRAAGQRCIEIALGNVYAQPGPDRFSIAAETAEDYGRVVESLVQASPPLAAVVHAGSLAPFATAGGEAAGMAAAQTSGSIGGLWLAQALAAREDITPRLWFVTAGAQCVSAADGMHAAALAQAPLVGFARTALSELPALKSTVVDLDSTQPAASQARKLAQELLAAGQDTEIAYRADKRLVARIEPLDPGMLAAAPVRSATPPEFRVGMSSPGILANLVAYRLQEPVPAKGQVLVDVRAVGVNFRDVMAATGMLPVEAEKGPASEALGLECAGVVIAVGPGVKGIKRGSRVMTSVRGALRSRLAVDADTVVTIPQGIDFAAAATIPTAFLTAYYALAELARLQRGERVLIHNATGGVGLAAIQVARLAGAEIYATAGSNEKRAYLRKMGIKHVADSRSLDFADKVRAMTRGEGVDVVLNAIAGPAIELGIGLLRPMGRFVEIGKRDVYLDSAIGLRALRANIALHVVDLASMTGIHAARLAGLFAQVRKALAAGQFTPLPVTSFPAAKAADAFRYMAQAKHIGKVVIEMDRDGLTVLEDDQAAPTFGGAGAHLVTGGLSGFGLAVAGWLADHGVRHLYLMSRSGAASAEAKAGVTALRKRGAKVTVVRGDVTKLDDVQRAVAAIAEHGVPLTGIFHAAMVLDDGFVRQLDADRMRAVLGPKVQGTWNLHTATAKAPVEHFVLFSSIAATLGSVGQANYSAANAFLDAFARARRAAGLPALSINWGPLGQTGVVQRNKALARYMKGIGMPPIELEDALRTLGQLMTKDVSSAAVLKVDWAQVVRSNPQIKTVPRLAEIAAGGQTAAGTSRLRNEIAAAPAAAKRAIVLKYLAEQVGRVLRIEAGKLEPERPLSELGLDSLTSFELKNRVESELAISLPVNKFLQKPTLSGLAGAIIDHIEEAPPAAEAAAAAEPQAAAIPADALPAAKSVGPGSVALVPPAGSGNRFSFRDAADRGLSSRQAHLWSIANRFTGIDEMFLAYNLGFGLRLKPRVMVDRLTRAFATLVKEHPILRTIYPKVEGRATAVVLDEHPAGLQEVDATGLSEPQFVALLTETTHRPFDFERGPLSELWLFHRPQDVDVILVRCSHIIMDGWSMQVLTNVLVEQYLGFSAFGGSQAERPIRYSDYIVREKAFLAGEEGKAQAAFWRRRTEQAPPLLELPFDRPRRPGAIQATAAIQQVFDAPQAAAIRRVAAELGASYFGLMQAAFKVLLYRYTKVTDLSTLATTANRLDPKLQSVIGWMNNVLIIRNRLDPDRSFADFVAAVTEATGDALAHQQYPVSEVLADAAATQPRIAAMFDSLTLTTGLWQVVFAMRYPPLPNGASQLMSGSDAEYSAAGITLKRLTLKEIGFKNTGTYVDLTVFVEDNGDDIRVEVNYNCDVFDAATIERLCADYRRVVIAAIADPRATIVDLVGEAVAG